EVRIQTSSGTAQRVSGTAWEFYGTNCAVEASASNVATSSSATCGSLAPATSGDLLFQYVFVSNSMFPTDTNSFASGTSGDGNIAWRLGFEDITDAGQAAAQYGVYRSTSVINPGITLSASIDFESVCVAMKPASQGADVPSGIQIRGIQHTSIT